MTTQPRPIFRNATHWLTRTWWQGGRALLGLCLAAVLVGLTACGGGNDGPTVRIGSKEFTEQYILGNLYQTLLRDAGFNARYTSIGGSSENQKAILAGEIDLYPEYTGTALLVHLEEDFTPGMSAATVYDIVKQQYAEQFQLTVLDPTNYSNSYVMVMPPDKVQALDGDTLSVLSAKAGDLVLGTTQEFIERADGLPGLQKLYGGFQFKDVIALDPGLLYSGLQQGNVDVATGFGTDGQITAYNLTVLQDDKGFWPPYSAVPVVRQSVVQQYPVIADKLNQLSAQLDTATMRRLNWEVAGGKGEPDEVARGFLEQAGLLGQNSDS